VVGRSREGLWFGWFAAGLRVVAWFGFGLVFQRQSFSLVEARPLLSLLARDISAREFDFHDQHTKIQQFRGGAIRFGAANTKQYFESLRLEWMI